MALKVEIVTPQRKVFSGEADQVQAPGWLGQMGVLPRHARLLSLTTQGEVILHQGGKQTRFVVGKGFVEVGDDQVTLLVDSCEAAAGQKQLEAH